MVLASEALVVPAGIVTAAYLGRSLGPAGYGLYSVAASFVITLEWTVAAMFSRATVKLVGEADDWRPAAQTVLRIQTSIGLALGGCVWLAADRLATAFAEPLLTPVIRWFALELPLAAISNAGRNVLTGRGRYDARAFTGAVRSVSRPFFVIGFVAAGWSIVGAVVGSVASAFLGALAVQAVARIPWRSPVPMPLRRVGVVALPMFVVALSVRFIDKLGVLALKMFGGTGQEAGFYAAAQNLSIVPSLFAMSFSPLLLAALAHALARRDAQSARRLSRTGFRVTLLLLPWAALLVGAAPEILRFVYGPGFDEAARLAGPLVGAGVAFAIVGVSTSMLLAADRARLASLCLWPVLPAAVVAHILVVPTYGAMGAATVTALAACSSMTASLIMTARVTGAVPPWKTVARSGFAGLVMLVLAVAWPTPGVWLLVKAVAGSAGAAVLLVVTGELTRDDLAGLKAAGASWIRKRVPASS